MNFYLFIYFLKIIISKNNIEDEIINRAIVYRSHFISASKFYHTFSLIQLNYRVNHKYNQLLNRCLLDKTL